ncbi:N-acetylglucosamine repressor [subsurface metagenome]
MKKFNELLLKIKANYNLIKLFNEIRKNGPIRKSRAGLNLPVSKPTRYALMKELLDENIVVETITTQDGKHRRTTVIDVIIDHFYSLGIDIHMEGIDLKLMNLKSNIKEHLFIPNEIDRKKNISKDSRSVIIERIQNGLKKIIDDSEVNPEDIIAFGISDAGMIDSKERVSIFNPYIPEWVDVPIGNIINRIIQVPVFLMRDSNLMAIAEIRSLGLKKINDLLCISLRQGIGLGIFINGQLYIGQTGNAGEWSQTNVFTAQKKDCGPGQKGGLDILLGLKSIMNLCSEMLNSREGNKLFERVGRVEDLSAKIVFQEYENGNEKIVSALNRYIETLGNQMANLVCIFDTGHFILAGKFVYCGEHFIQQLTNNVKGHLHSIPYQNIKIIKGKLGVKAASWGAAYMAQEMLFNPKQQILS